MCRTLWLPLALLPCGAFGQEEPLDWRAGDAYFTEDLTFWETIYPDTVLGTSDEAAEGVLSVQNTSEGSVHEGLCCRLPDFALERELNLEVEPVRRIVCYVRCSQPGNGYVRVGSTPDVWADYWGVSHLTFATDRWTRIEVEPATKRVTVDGMSAGSDTVEGEFDPDVCSYFAVFNTYGQQEGDFLLVDGLKLNPPGPFWYGGPSGNQASCGEPTDPRGPYTGALTCLRALHLYLGLDETAELLRQTKKVQFLVKTSRDADQVSLRLTPTAAGEGVLEFGPWQQQRERYRLVEYIPAEGRVTLDGQEVRCQTRRQFDGREVRHLQVWWQGGCAINDTLTIENLVFVPESP